MEDDKLLRLSLLMIDELLLRLRACCPPGPSLVLDGAQASAVSVRVLVYGGD